MFNLLGIYLIIFYLCFAGYNSSLSCKNEDNKDVDWYIILKFPASYNYFYLSSDSNSAKWITPNYALNDNRNLLSLTLTQMYSSQRSGTFFALYNDEKPLKRQARGKSTGGHLKGVVNFDSKTGYWLVHSVPKFPNMNTYNYTNGESINGQSFFCVSLGVSTLKSIASQLLMMYANVHAYNLPGSFSSDADLMNTLYKMVTNQHIPGMLSQRINFSTIKGLKLSHFGKSEQCFEDLYYDIIMPDVNTSLFVESWMNGSGEKLHTNCLTNNKVYNVRKVSINGITYSEEVDHSKWAVSSSQTPSLVCIGDINRMVTQKSRGGGSLCLFDSSVWRTFYPIVKEYEPCPRYDFVL